MWKVEALNNGVWEFDSEYTTMQLAMHRYSVLNAIGKKARVRKPTGL